MACWSDLELLSALIIGAVNLRAMRSFVRRSSPRRGQPLWRNRPWVHHRRGRARVRGHVKPQAAHEKQKPLAQVQYSLQRKRNEIRIQISTATVFESQLIIIVGHTLRNNERTSSRTSPRSPGVFSSQRFPSGLSSSDHHRIIIGLSSSSSSDTALRNNERTSSHTRHLARGVSAPRDSRVAYIIPD